MQTTVPFSMTDQTTAGDPRGAGRAPARAALRLLFAGPAVIASIAYMDPGNFATNIQAGAQVRLHAALGRAAGEPDRHAVPGALRQARHRHRPQPRRDVPRAIPARRSSSSMWGASEVAAMATDLAEFLGGAIGLSLLFRIPLLAGMVVTAIVTYAHPAVRAARLPPDRAHHRRLRRGDRPLLPDRDVHRAGRTGAKPRCIRCCRPCPTPRR